MNEGHDEKVEARYTLRSNLQLSRYRRLTHKYVPGGNKIGQSSYEPEFRGIPNSEAEKSTGWGEIKLKSFVSIIAYWYDRNDIQEDDVFLDAGSGFGKVSILVGISGFWKNSYGIELLPSRHKIATQMLSASKKKFPTCKKLGSVILKCGSFLDYQYNQILRASSHIFMNAVVFNQSLLENFFHAIGKCKKLRYIAICFKRSDQKLIGSCVKDINFSHVHTFYDIRHSFGQKMVVLYSRYANHV